MSLPSLPIAVFDSGLGGLSVAQPIRARLPHASLLYFADCGWAPYGDRPQSVILARVRDITDWLIGQQVCAVVVACNTATTIAISALREDHPEMPLVGVEPGVKPAVMASRSRVVGVLATQATLRTQSFQALLAKYAADCRFVCQAGHGLVALIEAGGLDTPALDALLQRYLDAMLRDGVDTLVLGSTHFPLLIPAIERRYGDAFTLIETGSAVANRLVSVLEAKWPGSTGAGDEPSGVGAIRLCSSLASPALEALSTRLLSYVGPAEIISFGESAAR